MDEFSLIKLITNRLGARHNPLGGVGDDASILEIPEGEQLVVSSDTLVAGVHFEAEADPADIGYKALAVNLSDLAAMGARPGWFFLALTLPALNADWISAFAIGLDEAARPAGIALAGGDTTHGPLSLTITVCGLVSRDKALLRSGARAGDVIGLSGVTGLAGLALQDRAEGRVPADACVAALDRPVARLELGQALADLAHSAIDVSDGLLADIQHIARASNVGVRVFPEKLPCPPEMAHLDSEARWELQLSAGDDYELCFTAPADHWQTIQARAESLGVPVIRIGEVFSGSGLECLLADGSHFEPDRFGYNHGVETR